MERKRILVVGSTNMDMDVKAAQLFLEDSPYKLLKKKGSTRTAFCLMMTRRPVWL